MKLKSLIFLFTLFLSVNYASAWEQDFVYVEGTKLMLNGEEYYFSNANAYEMLYNQETADKIFAQAQTLGVNALRFWGFWNDANESSALQALPGQFIEQNWKKFDYVLWKAEQLGIKLIIPLGNYWPEFGGADYYVEHSPTASEREDFYTDAHCIQMYKDYIYQVLNRENTYKNGKKYKDDSTVMIWELMNEPRGKTDISGNKVYNWVDSMARYVHELDPQRKHLVATGEEGFLNDYGSSWDTPVEGSFFKKNGASPEIDILSFHMWPINWGKSDNAEAFIAEWLKVHKDIADGLGKPLYLGEFGWQINRTGESTVARRDEIYSWTYAKALQYNFPGTGFWELIINEDPGQITGGDLKFQVMVPGDTSSVQIIQDFTDQVLSDYTRISDFRADHTDVVSGRNIVLSWDTRFADSVTLDGQPVADSGSISLTPNASRDYVIEAYGQISSGVWGTLSKTISVNVGPARAASIVLSASQNLIGYGERIDFSGSVLDQMGEFYANSISWNVNGGGELTQNNSATTEFLSDGSKGNFLLTANYSNVSANVVFEVGEKQINDNLLNYSAGWNAGIDSNKFHGDDHYSSTAGATYSLNFYGQGIAIYAPKEPHHGSAWVSIDGGAEQEISFKAPLRALNSKIWQSSTLSKGEHTLSLRVVGDGVIVADRFEVINDDPISEINDSEFNYSGNWTTTTGNGKFLRDEHRTSESGASYTTHFLGTKAQLYATTDNHYGTATVTLNGQQYTVDFSSNGYQENTLVWESSTLPYGVHSLSLSAHGNGEVTADKLVVTKALANDIVNDSAFNFQGTWNQSTGEGKYEQDDHYSFENGASFEVNVTGTHIRIFGPLASHHGTARVYIDGQEVGIANFANNTRIDNTMIWESQALANGNHTLRVEAVGDGVIVADRVEAANLEQQNQGQPIMLEAETASLSSGVQVASSYSNYSGSGYVTDFNESGDSVTWTFTLSESKTYTLNFRYASGYGTKYNSVYVDNQKETVLEFPATADFDIWNEAGLSRYFSAGTHSVSVRMDGDSWGWINIDSLSVE